MVSLRFVLSRVCVFLYSLGPRSVFTSGSRVRGEGTRRLRIMRLHCESSSCYLVGPISRVSLAFQDGLFARDYGD